MLISDRLDKIEARRAQANSSLNCRHMLVGKDVPEMLAALRAVLNLHTESRLGPDLPHPYCGECGQMLPCATRRAIAATLGEGA